ncbi:hypothetical protein ACS0TY_001064 [Phlomoides rotata]
MARGEEPYSLEDLTRKLEATWNIYGGWKLVPIGRGYYNVQLPNLDDRDRILDRSSWPLKPGVVWVQRWVRDFNPYKTNTSIAQVWVRLFEIPMEYFLTPIIHALASSLGTVIKIDDRTKDRSMCHYARVLIELDMKQNFEDYVMFETEGHYLFASVKYESLPPFCNGCGIVGHKLVDYRMSKPKARALETQAKAPPRVQPKAKPPAEVWIQKGPVHADACNDACAVGVDCQNSFAALAEDTGDIQDDPPRVLDDANHSVETAALGQATLVREQRSQNDTNYTARDDNQHRGPDAIGSNNGSFSNTTVRKAHAKKGKRTANVHSEYNLRNKPSSNASSSMPADDSYVLTSDVSNKALASMRLATGMSWADAAEEANNPPKHGEQRLDLDSG